MTTLAWVARRSGSRVGNCSASLARSRRTTSRKSRRPVIRGVRGQGRSNMTNPIPQPPTPNPQFADPRPPSPDSRYLDPRLSTPAIEIAHLHKAYGRKIALHDLDLTVQP